MSIVLMIAGRFLLPVIAFGEVDIRYTNGGFKVATGDHWIKIGGTMMWDIDSASAGYWDSEDDDEDQWRTHSELRRSRLNIKAKITDDWKAKLQFELAENEAANTIKDAYVNYCGLKYIDIVAGQSKEPFGLEAMTSSKNLSFIERSMVSNAFRPGRHLGILLDGDTKRLIWQLGVYEALNREDEDDGDTYAASGRLGVSPWKADGGFFHVGGSGSFRDFDGEEFKIKASGEIHPADNIIFSEAIDTDHLLLYGLETALGIGPFSLQVEYMRADVYGIDEEDDVSFEGYYLAASWFLTGEAKPFKKGGWGRVEPESTYGAWELVMRYSNLDAAANDQGNSAESCTAGINWHINSNVRLMADYVRLLITDGSADAETDADAVSFRVQCVF
jgi:phosphate-selective porin OprO/OprP